MLTNTTFEKGTNTSNVINRDHNNSYSPPNSPLHEPQPEFDLPELIDSRVPSQTHSDSPEQEERPYLSHLNRPSSPSDRSQRRYSPENSIPEPPDANELGQFENGSVPADPKICELKIAQAFIEALRDASLDVE